MEGEKAREQIGPNITGTEPNRLDVDVLFRFGMRWDVAVVEVGQINRYVVA